jgi:hypothetical protein
MDDLIFRTLVRMEASTGYTGPIASCTAGPHGQGLRAALCSLRSRMACPPIDRGQHTGIKAR